MKTNWLGTVSSLALAMVATSITACGSQDMNGFDDQSSDESAYDDGASEDGDVLGTAEMGITYPNCVSSASDPDGDGWGWENNQSCKVVTSGTAYPTCVSAASDPDGDGWGWENAKSCKVATGGTGGGTPTACVNPEGTASTMAAVAVAAAMEMKRWQPTKDFVIGKVDNVEALVISATGKARCADGVCAKTQALIDFQKTAAQGKIKFPGNVTLDVSALRSRMVAKFRDQLSCEMQPSNGGTTNCPVEEHTLTFISAVKGGCDTVFNFRAKTPTGAALVYPGQLKNKLKFADTTNPYIGFQSVGDVVSIDPTYGLNDDGTTSTGACVAACTKISTTNAAGACCTCNGSTKAFAKSAWSATTFLCQ